MVDISTRMEQGGPLTDPLGQRNPAPSIIQNHIVPFNQGNDLRPISWPIEPEKAEVAQNVHNYILGVPVELGPAGEDAKDNGPIYVGAQIALRDDRYLQDGCSDRLEEVAKKIVRKQSTRSNVPTSQRRTPDKLNRQKNATGNVQTSQIDTLDKLRLLGNCRGANPETFYPEVEAEKLSIEEEAKLSVEAKAICAGCRVLGECLEYAIAAKEPGVWGGTTKRERDRIIRMRRKARRACQTAQS